MSITRLLITLLLMASTQCGFGQLSLSGSYTLPSMLKDKAGNEYGEGDLQKYSARLSLPIERKVDSNGKMTAVSLTLYGSYAAMNNKSDASPYCPAEVLSAGVAGSMIRSLSGRWSMIAMLGCGINSAPNDIAWRSIMGVGSAIFIYRVNKTFAVGIGGGLTNAYGAPMILPMGYLDCRLDGSVKFNVNIANAPRITVTKEFGKQFSLDLTAIEIDGLSSVARVDGKTKIWSSMTLASCLTANVKISRSCNFYVGIGGDWKRAVKLTDRSISAFFESIGDDSNRQYFKPQMRVTSGFKWNFR